MGNYRYAIDSIKYAYNFKDTPLFTLVFNRRVKLWSGRGEVSPNCEVSPFASSPVVMRSLFKMCLHHVICFFNLHMRWICGRPTSKGLAKKFTFWLFWKFSIEEITDVGVLKPIYLYLYSKYSHWRFQRLQWKMLKVCVLEVLYLEVLFLEIILFSFYFIYRILITKTGFNLSWKLDVHTSHWFFKDF